MKSVKALLFVLVLTLTTLAGCSSKEEDSTVADPGATDSSGTLDSTSVEEDSATTDTTEDTTTTGQ